MARWLWFILGALSVHVIYALAFALVWWRAISRDKPEPPMHTRVDRIVRDIGTLTVYSWRN